VTPPEFQGICANRLRAWGAHPPAEFLFRRQRETLQELNRRDAIANLFVWPSWGGKAGSVKKSLDFVKCPDLKA
jgi:hypothetical protein